MHKDIKPANILIDPDSKQIKLIDFSIASLLPRQTQEIQSPNNLEGTLAYLAPEQTGRMNRSIDYRADFYALGITLYQLLSGRLPFAADDPLELVHCHIAKVAIPVNQVQVDVPIIVAAIVAKLMEKNAEDRYQSALGLKHDLEQCLQAWKATGTIAVAYKFSHDRVQQAEYLQQVRTNQTQYKIWVDNCPKNFLHKYLLVEAELYRIQGDRVQAADCYDRAIATAKANQFTQIEALAAEFAGRFYLA